MECIDDHRKCVAFLILISNRQKMLKKISGNNAKLELESYF